MSKNYPTKTIAFIRNKLLFIYHALQAVSNTRQTVPIQKINQVFLPEFIFNSNQNKTFFIDTKAFKNQPIVTPLNLFYILLGSAMAANLSIINRHRRKPYASVYARVAVATLKQTSFKPNFKNKITK